MGNSGSINSIPSEHEDLAHFQHSLIRSSEHQPLKWTQSFPRDGYLQQRDDHAKVLPDLNEGTRLRFTPNGAILHSGGTISGRNGSAIQPPLLQRSKTSIHYDLSSRHNSEPFNGFQTKQSNIQNREYQNSSYKRFGSEPDLRVQLEENSGVGQPKISKSKMVKNKKKTNAPFMQDSQNLCKQPPQNYSSSNNNQQKKLRLFKTKAESRKPSIQPRVAAEASDVHFKRSMLEGADQETHGFRKQASAAKVIENKNILPSDSNNWRESKVKVFPIPAFRREKSFDISLLANRNKLNVEETSKKPLERQGRFSNLMHRSVPEKHKGACQTLTQPESSGRKPPIETNMRKYSQPGHITNTDFKKELEEATKRRSMIVESVEKIPIIVKKKVEDDSKALRCNVPKSENTLNVKTEAKFYPKNQNLLVTEKSYPNNVELKKRSESKIPQLRRTFYFGMDEKNEASNDKKPDRLEKIQTNTMNGLCKESIRQMQERISSESSESALSSEEGYTMSKVIESYDENVDGGIHVHVRPSLPRRQLEIPRFSPAAAWRMLNDDQKVANFLGHSSNQYITELIESKPPLEERIQRTYREPNPLYGDNKSGDSGISGDAGLLERTDSPRQNFVNENDIEHPTKFSLKPWIPQHDLEESSTDDEVAKVDNANKYSSRGNVFSLSLPRESHLSVYEEKDKPGFSSLQKLKKRVSNAFTPAQDRTTSYRNDNWLLSRSAPNSIENSQVTIENYYQMTQDNENLNQKITIQPSSFSYFTGGKHMIYLPNRPDLLDLDKVDVGYQQTHMYDVQNSGQGPERKSLTNNKLPQYKDEEQEHVLDTTTKHKKLRDSSKPKKSREHRFAFQSAVRQIERRRLAEKLSKDAEEKEAQRLNELEAMRKVEEEFQRKRAREKASIRRQLQLFSMDGNQCTSLPVEWQALDVQNKRADPDGAVSSPTPSPTSLEVSTNTLREKEDEINGGRSYLPKMVDRMNSGKYSPHNRKHQIPTTEVLSEFRTVRREYLEYRRDRKMDSFPDQQTDHPAVVCKIPSKSNEANIYEDCQPKHNSMLLHNYRRDFARTRSTPTSDSETSTASEEEMVNRRTQYRYRSRSPSL